MKHLSGLFLLFAVLICSCTTQQPADISIIPQPNEIIIGDGANTLSGKILISVDNTNLLADAEYLSSQLSKRFGLKIDIQNKAEKSVDILLRLDPEIQNPEGYVLKSEKSGVEIAGQSAAGVFYGIQSLLQLLPLEGSAVLPVLEIIDEPRFVWRGMMLDVGRHYFEIDSIKKILDGMAMHKLNTFHWHLTEDQGWRIEIEQYPKLAKVAAWRDETLVGHYREKPHTFDGTRHGGYYTKEQITELVEYAEKLHITIVPEIEMPGHSEAAIAAYPELSCFNSSEGVVKIWGVRDNVYCAGKESTFEFLENVIDEIVDLFPGEYFHIGGDECPKTHWEECPDCQKRIREEGLKDEHELQSYFIQRMEKFLNSRGKKIIGWDEILEGGLAENAAVMSWRGEEGGIEAANLGHNVVMTPTKWCYFDYCQSENKEEEPLAIGGFLPMYEVYGYDPMPEKIDPDKQHLILGVQANVWTEYIPTTRHAEYMIYPRLCAMSEVQWTSPENKDYDQFLEKMELHYARLDAAKINFRSALKD